MLEMTESQCAAAFNEWMRQYTEDPEAFRHTTASVLEFLAETAADRTPTYGEQCVAFLKICHGQLTPPVAKGGDHAKGI